MADTDEQIIREFLNCYPLSGGEASSALDRILSRMLPELPEGNTFFRLMFYPHEEQGELWEIEIITANGNLVLMPGPTPRAACEAAIAKIGKQP
jgi:hypothetical protein